MPSNAGRTLYLLAGVGGDEPRLVRFCAACAPTLRVLLVDYGDWPDWTAPGFALDEIVARTVAAIEAQAPEGPILLGGYSLGAEIAYAVAMALSTAGRRIGFLAILDADISRGGAAPQPGALQRLLTAIRRGEAAERIASYLSQPLANPPREWRLRLAARICRLGLPGNFGFHLHRHIRRHLLTGLVTAWWAERPSPLPQLQMPAVLFRSTEHRADAPEDLGWRQLCPSVTSVAVSGGHNTMFDPPNLEPLCARFTASALAAA